MNDFFNIITTDEFYMIVTTFFGLFLFIWLIKLGINVIIGLFKKI